MRKHIRKRFPEAEIKQKSTFPQQDLAISILAV